MAIKLSKVALGLWRARKWNYSTSELANLISNAIDLGITTFDHADIYGDYECETLFGEVLKSNSGLRNKMEIVTKCGIKMMSPKFPDRAIGHYDTSKEHIISSVEKSLLNLKTDRIDLLLIHRPDPLMNADETAEAFTELKNSGKVLEFGVSNFLPHHFTLLQSRLSFPLITNQIEVSVLNHEHFDNGNIDFLQEKKIRPMVWSPFAGGRLFTDGSEKVQRTRSMLSELQNKYGASSIESIAAAWLFVHPVNFIVVLGTGNIGRIKLALEGLSIKLKKEDWFRIWVASRGQNVP